MVNVLVQDFDQPIVRPEGTDSGDLADVLDVESGAPTFTRRRFGVLLSAFVAAGAALPGCERKPLPNIDLGIDKNISIPEATIRYEEKYVKKPDFFSGTEEEFVELVNKAGIEVARSVRAELIPALEGATSPEIRDEIYRQFLTDRVCLFLMSASPEFNEDIMRFVRESTQSGSMILMEYLNNTFFHSSNFHLDGYEEYPQTHGVPAPRFYLNLNRIKSSSEIATVTGDGLTDEARIFRLDEGMVPYEYRSRTQLYAATTRSFDKVLVFEGHVEKKTREDFAAAQVAPEYAAQVEDAIKVASRQDAKDAVSHELSHVFLEAAYPGYSGLDRNMVTYLAREHSLPLKFKVGEEEADLSGRFSLRDLDEACAVARSLALAESGLLKVFYDAIDPGMRVEYQLGQLIVELAMVSIASDSPAKQDLLRGLLKGEPIDLDQVLDLKRQGDRFSLDEVHRIGEVAYRLAFDLFRRAVTGEFKQ